MTQDYFGALSSLVVKHKKYSIYRLEALERAGLVQLSKLPYSIRVLLESALRQCNEKEISKQDVVNIASWKPVDANRPGIPFLPARVLMQDFTGVPAIVDLAAMRSAMSRLGGDPKKVNPIVPVDLVIDHSIQVDFFSTSDALQRNTEIEFQRNRERYEFLKWGQESFDHFRVVPPATGIVHQVNLEYLSPVVMARKSGNDTLAFPDSLVGTDSHTTMINGLGVVGWGVGGIEAEAVMLGQPMDMLLPDVIGFRLEGRLRDGVTATDLVLTITEMLRRKGVVGKFVEFFGPGIRNLPLPDRATIGNMAPEYGATLGFFPVDTETLNYLRMTGRPEELIQRTELYCRKQDLFHDSYSPEPSYTDTLSLDLAFVQTSLAGPKRPQDRVNLGDVQQDFKWALTAPVKERGFELKKEDLSRTARVGTNGGSYEIGHGAVVIAAITSCTNTSNPAVMLAAGLVAKKAIEKGLSVQPQVKTSLAPGSRVVTEYLEKAKLLEPLAKLGFNLVGYGCTTCIGNSGPLPGEVAKAIGSQDIVATAVLSGNRNFEGRVHPQVKANYLASPPLVVAYALAGTVDINLEKDPLGTGQDGQPVYLKDIWPSSLEVIDLVLTKVDPHMFVSKYADVFEGSQMWKDIQVSGGDQYAWSETSTYIQEPPFFKELSQDLQHIQPILKARVLGLFGDSITTDHISPAGNIASNSPAGKYLQDQGVAVRDFNSYGSRRGNDRVMTRATFANIRLKNLLVPGVEGGVTHFFGKPEQDTSIYEAAMQYQAEGIPTIILAGKEYGAGSSRDWAAKGTLLLGVKAVVAESFERIHRSNLVGMGVLPLQFEHGQSAESLGLKGNETFDFAGLTDNLQPQSTLAVKAQRPDGSTLTFNVKVLLNTPLEVEYYRNGGILQTVLRKMLKTA